MQFFIIAKDGRDAEALNRRLAAREAHIALGNDAVDRGEQIFGAAMLNENGAMVGSLMAVEFPSEYELRDWLDREPYVVGKVWQNIEILPCRIGPSFQHFVKARP